MSITSLTWQAHRLAIDRLGFPAPFLGTRHKRLLFITDNNSPSPVQIFPFWHHRSQLASRYGIDIRELPLAHFEQGRNPHAGLVDAVCFQARPDLATEAMGALAFRIRNIFPSARLAYLDGSASTNPRHAEVLNPYISAYVKTQLLRERRRYRETILGDNHLSDYYARRLRIAEPMTKHLIPDEFWHKLWVGPHFAFSPEMLPYFQRGFPSGRRDIDLHARFGTQGAEWYAAMRREAMDKAVELEGRYRVLCSGTVPRKEFLGELFRSLLCFSPFGHGEICQRDFQAMAAGSLLLKPDMSHLECYPEVFLPYETYVPLAWDLSDFEEKAAYYLSHEAEREAIAKRAFDLLKGYFRQNRFMEDVEPLLVRLGLAESEIPAVAGERDPAMGMVMPREPATPGGIHPRILLSAYQCGPGMDSASRIGWEWYRRLAARTAVTLVTDIRNKQALEQAGAPPPGSEIVYIDTEWFAGPLRRLASWLVKQGSGPDLFESSLDFYVHDGAALRVLRRRRKAGAVWDLVHQPTPVSPLAATRLHRLGLPLVLGPWNGGLRSPEAFPEFAKSESHWNPRGHALAGLIDRLRGATRNASLILVATQATRADLPVSCRDRCRPMLEEGVDTEIFRPEPWPAPPSATQSLRVLFVGRLSPRKGVDMLLEALARVRARSPVELAIVGAGTEETALRAAAEALGLDDCVRFTGTLSQTEVAAELARTHVCCLPSVRESSGTVLLEAMAAARPVIALDHGAPAEIVDSEVGLLIPATGHRSVVERLTWALIDIMNAPEVWRLRGQAGRSRVEQRFGWDARIDAALALYREIL